MFLNYVFYLIGHTSTHSDLSMKICLKQKRFFNTFVGGKPEKTGSQCCGSKYIKYESVSRISARFGKGFGSRISARIGNGSGSRVNKFVKKKIQKINNYFREKLGTGIFFKKSIFFNNYRKRTKCHLKKFLIS